MNDDITPSELNEQSQPAADQTTADEVAGHEKLSEADEQIILDRLRELGYVE